MPDALVSLILDPATNSLLQPYLTEYINPANTVASGTEQESDWWLDPDKLCLMLKPYQYYQSFSSSDTNVPRLRKNQFIYSVGAGGTNWQEVTPGFATDYWLLSNGVDETVTTTTEYEPNQGFFFRFQVIGDHNYNYEVCRLTFGGYELRIGSDGYTELWESGGTEALQTGRIAPAGSRLSGIVELLILPYRRRSILFATNAGYWVYTNYDESDTWLETSDYTITTAGKFSFRFPYCTAQCQLTPVRYPATGTWTSPVQMFHRAPTADQAYVGFTNCDEWHDTTITADVMLSDGTTPFVADAETMTFTVKVTFTANGDRTHSPIFYYAVMDFSGVAGTTPARSTDIIGDVLPGFTLSLGDDFTGDSLTFRIRNPETWQVEQWYGTVISLQIAGSEYWRGVVTETKYGLEPSELVEIGEVTCKDWFAQRAEYTLLSSADSLGGISHTEALTYLAEFAGLGATDMSVYADTAMIPWTHNAEGNANDPWRPEAGDTVLDWLRRIQELSGDWILDTYPESGVAKLRYTPWEDRDKTAIMTYYPDPNIPANTWDTWVRQCDLGVIPPDCNELWVMGCNERGQPIACVYYDVDSQNPALPRESRAANWLGHRRVAVVQHGGYRDTDTLRRVCRSLSRKVMSAIPTAEWEAEWRPGVWRNDVVTLNGYGDYRIRSMQISFDGEFAGGAFRSCRFQGEKIA